MLAAAACAPDGVTNEDAFSSATVIVGDPGQVGKREELTLRTEVNLGTASCSPRNESSVCQPDPWLSTEASRFVPITRRVFMSGSTPAAVGSRLASSFVAQADATNVAVTFSADAYVEHLSGSGPRTLALRVLIDGEPVANPADIVFASGPLVGSRSFTFTTRVPRGLHTAEVEWKVAAGGRAHLRNATLFVRMGRTEPTDYGALFTHTPASGPSVVTNLVAFSDIPGMVHSVYVPADGPLTVTFSAESWATKGKRGAVRALVDGVPLAPSDIVFVDSLDPQSRAVTLGTPSTTAGWHQIRVQWAAEAGGTFGLGDRSLVVAAFPHSALGADHPYVAPPSGAPLPTSLDAFTPVPGLMTSIVVPPPGNGEAAVVFTGELAPNADAAIWVALAVDGVLQADSIIQVMPAQHPAESRSVVLEAKHMSAGVHRLDVLWRREGAGTVYVGDRSMAVASEVGFIPDLAESYGFGGGHIAKLAENDTNPPPIDPLVGSRDVLIILAAPNGCGGVEGCLDPEAVPKSLVEETVYGAPGMTQYANRYLALNSGGRFRMRNAGVLGWYVLPHDADHYWRPETGTCDDALNGFASGHSERFADAVELAKADFDFTAYDKDGDGTVRPDELAIFIFTPQVDIGGGIRTLFAQTCPTSESMTQDGVVIGPRIVEVLGDPNQLHYHMTFAHELLHLVSNADDAYGPSDHATYSSGLTSMGQTARRSPWVDPWTRLMLGWVTPVHGAPGAQALLDVKQGDEVLVLPRYHQGDYEELFVVENRYNPPSTTPGFYEFYFDAPDALEDDNDSGLAVWHVVTTPDQALLAPRGNSYQTWQSLPDQYDTMSRMALRLIRPWNAMDVNGDAILGGKAWQMGLWSAEDYDLKSASCVPVAPGPPPDGDLVLTVPARNTLSWADCAASGYSITNLSADGLVVTFDLDTP